MARRPNVDGYSVDLFGETPERRPRGPLASEFGIPPFSVLDARAGDWQDRKRDWLALGFRSEVGRDARAYNMGLNAAADNGWTLEDDAGSGVSVFDALLCEACVRWYSPRGGLVLDPFAGGSVRGIMAAMVGRRYYGIELRPQQVTANREQAAAILADGSGGDVTDDAPVTWVVGDAAQRLADAPPADAVFTCPPYGDLERYSDDPADLSAMTWPAFADAYRRIVAAAVARLKPNSFSAWVVGNYRDQRTGVQRDLAGLTVAAHADAGAAYWNDHVLVTATGTLALRTGKQFRTSRKAGRGHQYVLVFVKGDGRAAAERCGPVYMED